MPTLTITDTDAGVQATIDSDDADDFDDVVTQCLRLGVELVMFTGEPTTKAVALFEKAGVVVI
ncbi:MAG: hypothetical protein ACREPE_10965 [Lysobacter sp.]